MTPRRTPYGGLQKYELVKAGAGAVAAALPPSRRFPRVVSPTCEKSAPKTIERYRELAAYLTPELLAKPLGKITPLHLGRE